MRIFLSEYSIKWYVALTILLVFTIAFFADVLFSKNLILSNDSMDIARQFYYWRDFGFSQLKHGNLALWNPHIFSGAPFMGGFQSALLYPPNIIFLILPTHKAINLSIAFHILLIGFLMYLWTRSRELHPVSCLCSSMIMMFSGGYYFHIYAGHLSNLCTLAWVPLLFLSIDQLFQRRTLKWSLIGILTITMLILAGHPQYVYYTALAAGSYTILRLIKSEHRIRAIISLAVIGLGGMLLSAVQIFSGLDAAGESMRGAVSYLYAASFSFPPENIILLLIPDFFGDMVRMDYWGRFYLWEMSIFISVAGLSLAIYGILTGDPQKRQFSFMMVIILLMLSLGAHTPLFNLLYHWLPGFNHFRGTSKFNSLLAIFLVMLSAVGLDTLLKNRNKNVSASMVLLTTGVILAGLSFWILSDLKNSYESNTWQIILNYIVNTGEAGTKPDFYLDPEFIQRSAAFASKAVFRSALICFVLAALFFMTKYHRVFAYCIAVVAVIEILFFAHSSKQSFDVNALTESDTRAFLDQSPGDYRIFNYANSNSGMSTGSRDIWGYDSAVPLRYAEFMNFAQPGLNPDNERQRLDFEKPRNFFSMLRCRYFFIPQHGKNVVMSSNDVMNRIQLISSWQVISQRDEIFMAMEKPGFDPRQTVILETAPGIESVTNGYSGECSIEESSTDHLKIKGKLERPAILLITDAFSKGWRAKPLPGSSQQKYEVMPANYILIAIPLAAGEHHLILEYKPAAFVVGKWIALSALAVYIAFVLMVVLRSTVLKNTRHPEKVKY